MNANTLLVDPHALEIEKFVSHDDSITIVVRTVQPTPRCPQCDQESSSLKARYLRRLADLPWHGVTATLELNARKFRCRNPVCPQKVFCERLPQVAPPHSRRTVRLMNILTIMSFALGTRRAAEIVSQTATPVGKDVCLRAMRRESDSKSSNPKVRVLGVDDFAFRRGHTYGTILVDLERRKPIDLLPDRTAETLSEWLTEHPKIEIVSRDRSQTYAAGVNAGAPAAVQVADRFHLVKNIVEAFERQLQRSQQALRGAAEKARRREQPEIARAPEIGNQNYAEKCGQSPPISPAKRAARIERYETARRLRAEGYSINEIGRQLRMHRETVRHFLAADIFPERPPAFRRASPVSRFDAYLQQRWGAGCANARQLFLEIKKQGYVGCYATLNRYLRRWREALPFEQQHSQRLPVRDAPVPRTVKWWLLRSEQNAESGHAEKEAEFCRDLLAAEPEIEQGLKLVKEFQQILKGGNEIEFENWKEKVQASSGIKELKNFVANLKSDERAVQAAVTTEWSNGQVEGQVNRLKTIKRQMYGRAKFDLLRARVLHQN